MIQLPGLGLKLVLVGRGMEGDRFLHPSASAIWEAMGSKEAQFHLHLKVREPEDRVLG